MKNNRSKSSLLNLIIKGQEFHSSGLLDQARKTYQLILSKSPGNFDALFLYGTLEAQSGNHNLAIELLIKANKSHPNGASSLVNLANIYKELHQYEKSQEFYLKALNIDSNDYKINYDYAVLLLLIKNPSKALSHLEVAQKAQPLSFQVYFMQGLAYLQLNDNDKSSLCFDKAININPEFEEAYLNRGNLYSELRKFDKALLDYQKAIDINPNQPEAYFNRGNLYQILRKYDDAVINFTTAITIKPDYSSAYQNLGTALIGLKQWESVLICYLKALELDPDGPYLLGLCLHYKTTLCQFADFEEGLSICGSMLAEKRKVILPFAALAIYDDPEIHLNAAYTYSRQFIKGIPKDFSKHKNNVIRIGYYSADLREHAVAYLIAEVFELHDKTKFEIYAFSFGQHEGDFMRERLKKSFHEFHEVNQMSDDEIVELSRELKIDIAVDLTGYTGDCRTGIFAKGCAPVQLNFLGYPGTMGTDFHHYIIGDKFVIPEKEQEFFSEKVIYLPNSYQPNFSNKLISDKVFTRQELGLPKSGFIYCCFNNNYKLLPANLDSWARILKSVDESVLWLLEDNRNASVNLKNELESRGVNGNRVYFAQRMPVREHLARHHLADLFLDSHPYNAHTTASDALWMGLPVLTYPGRSFASRVASSLLNALDIPELIKNSREEYEQTAIELGKNKNELQRIKNKIEVHKFSKPLFNPKLFTNDLEAAFEKIHLRHLDGLPPDHLYI